MRQTATTVAVLAMAWAAARADQITIKRILRPNVQVTDVANCKITYQLRGSEFDRYLRDVDLIQLDGRNDFNQAEKRVAEGNALEAVFLYDKAAEAEADNSWRMWLIRHRRLRALNAQKMIDRAVADWLAIVGRSSASRPSVALCPTGVDKAGSEANAQAARLLKAKLATAKDKALQARIRELLGQLGVDASATGTATPTPKPAPTGTVGEPTVTTDVSVNSGRLRGTLKEAADALKGGQYAAAGAKIRAGLADFSSRELPAALLLHGKALLLSYEKGGNQSRTMLLEAGLSFMRVAACVDPSHAEVPEAMYLAASVCRHLGNKVAAANAYRRIRQRHAGTPWAEKARRAEQALGLGR